MYIIAYCYVTENVSVVIGIAVFSQIRVLKRAITFYSLLLRIANVPGAKLKVQYITCLMQMSNDLYSSFFSYISSWIPSHASNAAVQSEHVKAIKLSKAVNICALAEPSGGHNSRRVHN